MQVKLDFSILDETLVQNNVKDMTDKLSSEQ